MSIKQLNLIFFSFGSWCWNSGSATGRHSSLSYTSSQPSISGVWLGPPKPEFNSCWVYKVTLSSQPDRGLCRALLSATVGFGRGARGGVARGAVPARLPALRSVHSALGSTCRSRHHLSLYYGAGRGQPGSHRPVPGAGPRPSGAQPADPAGPARSAVPGRAAGGGRAGGARGPGGESVPELRARGDLRRPEGDCLSAPCSSWRS